MAYFPGQKRVGALSVLFGLSSWAVGLLDMWGRGELLVELSHVAIFRFIFNPYVTPLAIFAGMYLLQLGKEKEFEEALQAAKEAPIIHGVERSPRPKQRPWKLLFLIPAAFVLAMGFIVIRLLTYTAPLPRPYVATIETHDELLEREGKKTPVFFRPSAPPKPSQNCPGGICAGGDISGSPTVNNNYAPPARRLSQSQQTEFSACLSAAKGSVGIAAISGDPDAFALATDWFTVFHNAGWSIDENRVAILIPASGSFSDTRFHLHGSINADGTSPQYDPSSAEGLAVSCFLGKPFYTAGVTNFEPSPNVPTGHLGIIVAPRSPGK